MSQTNRIARLLVVSSCGSPKPYPGSTAGSFHYDVYAFTNTSPADACVSVLLTAGCAVQAGVYLNSFDPLNIATNYLGDSGYSTDGGPQSCSVTVPAGAKFLVTEQLCGRYWLQLHPPIERPALSAANLEHPIGANQQSAPLLVNLGGWIPA